MTNPIGQALRDLRMKWKLFLTNATLLTVLVVTTGMVSYNIALQSLEARQKTILSQNIRQSVILLDHNLGLYEGKVDVVLTNRSLQDALQNPSPSFFDIFTINQAVKDLELTIQQMDYSSTTLRYGGSDPARLVIYSANPALVRDGGYFLDLQAAASEDWTAHLDSAASTAYWRGPFTDHQVRYISISKTMISSKDLKKIGIVSILIPESKVINLLAQSNTFTSGDILLVDAQHQVIQVAHSKSIDLDVDISALDQQQDGLFDIELQGRRYIISRSTSAVTGWMLVAVMPYSVITDPLAPLTTANTFILGGGVLICLALSFLTASLMSARLKRFTDKLSATRNFSERPLSVIEGHDEIGQLDRTFNNLIQTLDEATQKQVKLSLQKASLQVELLQAQINPHLLYNTLATISYNARKAKAGEISEVTDALIRFYRRFLNKGELISTFGNELEIVMENIRILKFTYGIDFDVDVKVDPDILVLPTLHLTLQPVVENAIVHGIRPVQRRGALDITGCFQGGDIIFTICDNGLGMEPHVVDGINNTQVDDISSGFGLMNVRKRIQLYYGESYGLIVQSQPEAGTTVRLFFPVVSRDQLSEKLPSA